MLKVPINPDVKEYSPKVVYGLDGRQFKCMAIALFLGYLFVKYVTCFEIINRITIAFILVLPVLACGWIFPYGMPLERFLLHIAVHYIMTPRKRLYRPEMAISEQMPSTKQKKKTRKEIKMHKKEVKKYGGVR